jgi:hypothetical protein
MADLEKKIDKVLRQGRMTAKTSSRTEAEKSHWLSAYDSAIRAALRDCKKQPDWQHLPAGHMRFAQGLSPKTAAKRYLAETIYGRQPGVRRVKGE